LELIVSLSQGWVAGEIQVCQAIAQTGNRCCGRAIGVAGLLVVFSCFRGFGVLSVKLGGLRNRDSSAVRDDHQHQKYKFPHNTIVDIDKH